MGMEGWGRSWVVAVGYGCAARTVVGKDVARFCGLGVEKGFLSFEFLDIVLIGNFFLN